MTRKPIAHIKQEELYELIVLAMRGVIGHNTWENSLLPRIIEYNFHQLPVRRQTQVFRKMQTMLMTHPAKGKLDNEPWVKLAEKILVTYYR